MLRSSNPTWKAFEKPQRWDDLAGSEAGGSVSTKTATMTVGGTAQAAGLQLGAAFLGAIGAWTLMQRGVIDGLAGGIAIGAIGVLLVGGFVLAAKPRLAMVLGPILSLVWGAFAGFASYTVAMMMGGILASNPEFVGLSTEQLAAMEPADARNLLVQTGAGIVFQAVLLTFGVAVTTLITTVTGLIRIRGMAAKFVMLATGGIAFLYIASIVLGFFGITIPFIREASPIGIAFSGFVVLLAAANLIMAYQNVEDGVRAGQPKYMEWYAGYAIVSTVVWLYIEVLYLLYKIYAMMNRE